MIVGIDLGTTNSLIGVMEKGRPRLFSDEGSTLIPSVVHFRSDGTAEVGAKAKEVRGSDPANTIFSAKRFMGRGLADVSEWTKHLPFDLKNSDAHNVRFRVGDKSYTPIEISARILHKLKRLAALATGEPIFKAVITVPAYFDDAQRHATKLAGEIAGLEVVRILNEPTAACLAYGLDKKTHGNVAIFDLGGGTFDISILSVKEGIFEVLATGGDTALGGDDFDHAIVEGVAQQMGIAENRNPLANAQLLVEAERIKKLLTTEEKAVFRFSHGGQSFEQEITRAQLEDWILPVLKRAEDPCRQALNDARLSPSQITDVILVGGSTRTPLVSRFVKDLFGREPICSLNPDEVVAMGATVQANVLAGQTGDILLLDVVPLSLGIETMGGIVSKIIHRNTTIPVSASEHFSTYVDGQTSVDIHVLQGERELVEDNRSLARFQLKGLPPLPAGIPKIEVEFIIDANGILNVHAIETRTGVAAAVSVNPSFGLTDSEIETMLMSSFDNAEQDFEKRFLVEARIEADALIRATRKSLEKGKDLLEAGEQDVIDHALSELAASLGASDHKEIKTKIEALNAATQSFAERLLNSALSNVLKDKVLDEPGRTV